MIDENGSVVDHHVAVFDVAVRSWRGPKIIRVHDRQKLRIGGSGTAVAGVRKPRGHQVRRD